MSIDDLEDEQVDDQLSYFKKEREKMIGESAAAIKQEEEEAEATLNAPNRKPRTDPSIAENFSNDDW